MFYVVALYAEFIPSEHMYLKAWLFKISCFIFGFLNNCMQIQIMNFIVNFHGNEQTNFSTGSGFCG